MVACGEGNGLLVGMEMIERCESEGSSLSPLVLGGGAGALRVRLAMQLRRKS